jgi:hypothetical protein
VEKGYCLSYTLFRKLGRFPSQMASNNDCDAYHETQLLYRIGPKIVEMWRTMEQCGEKVLWLWERLSQMSKGSSAETVSGANG